jgi:uncharacterized phage infection (PIP) family protein YhgE
MENKPLTNPTPVTADQLTQALENFSSQIDGKFNGFEKRIVTRLEKKIENTAEASALRTAAGFADMEERFGKMDDRFNKQDENLEKLAMATADGFKDMEGRFGKMDDRFKKQDETLEKMVTAIAERFDDVDARIEAVHADLKGDIQRIDFHITRQHEIEDERDLDTRVTTLEQKVGLKPVA